MFDIKQIVFRLIIERSQIYLINGMFWGELGDIH
jgi:hypothetical protein